MPRCLSLRASESNWATLGDFSGFSVDSDFANGRYPEYRSSAPVLRHPRFGTARQPPPEFDKFRSRMNSESPLRISSMVLTVGSILCCITAVSYLAPKLTPRLNSTDPAIIAANALQMNLSEFQTKGGGGHGVALSHQPALTSRPPHFSASKPSAIASVSATLLKGPMATPHADARHSVPKQSRLRNPEHHFLLLPRLPLYNKRMRH